MALLIVVSVIISIAMPQRVETAVLAVEGDLFFAQEKAVGNDLKFPESGVREARYDMYVVATAYSSDPRQTDATPCTPAMGSFDLCKNFEKYGLEDTIAANFLPLGAQVRFPELYGDKIFTVRDRMNARYNGTRRIDFWVASVTPTDQKIIQEAKQKARNFGVQKMKMEVL